MTLCKTEINFINSISKSNYDIKIDLNNPELSYLKYWYSKHNYKKPFCHKSFCNCDEIKKHLTQLKRINSRRSKNV